MNKKVQAAPPPGNPRSRRWRSRGIRAVLYVALAYVVWCAVLYFYQDKLVFPADMAPAAAPTLPWSDARTERLVLSHEGGEAEAWLCLAPAAGLERPAPVVIFCHGNAEIVDGQRDIVGLYHRLGCSVLLPEYRGYGRSAGTPTEAGIVADVVAFHDQLLEREDVDRSRIVLHGRSLGGGVAAQVAAQRAPAAMILQSTFSSVARMARSYFVPSFLAKHPFRTDRVIGELDIPLLIFHGTQDSLIPVEHGRRLGAIAGERAVYVEYDCDHNNFPGRGNNRDYTNRIAAFLAAAGITASPAAEAAADDASAPVKNDHQNAEGVSP
ncbi:MAG: alpha/beta hydrolase [Phycisphaerae bacterium]|nr:alpha/beta hydrolase [Phycisphaerae bacterium]